MKEGKSRVEGGKVDIDDMAYDIFRWQLHCPVVRFRQQQRINQIGIFLLTAKRRHDRMAEINSSRSSRNLFISFPRDHRPDLLLLSIIGGA